MPVSAAVVELIEAARQLDKHSIARLISLLENEDPRSVDLQADVLNYLDPSSLGKKQGLIVGFAGPPGAGKSTLVGSLVNEIIRTRKNARVAVVAVDPSSSKSRGSLLGDRTRTHFDAREKRIFFRSQAADMQLGGVGPHTFSVCRLLTCFFDLVLIETVGIGQSEIEIQELADFTFLVVQPFAGDQLQFIKAGIMEVPNAFIVNKADDIENSRKSYHQLKVGLEFLNLQDAMIPPVYLASSISREGIAELGQDIWLLVQNHDSETLKRKNLLREKYFLAKAVKEEFGNWGLEVIQNDLNHLTSLGFEKNLESFLKILRIKITTD